MEIENDAKSKFWIFLLVTSKILILEFIISFFFQGHFSDLAISLQHSSWLYIFSKNLTYLCSTQFKDILLIFIFCFCNHYDTILYSTTLYSTLFISNFIKLIYQEPRAFWIDSNIINYECEMTYGFPSNHIISTVPVFLLFWDIISYRFNLVESQSIKCNKYLYICILIHLFVIFEVIAMIFLGSETINQAVFSYFLGCCIYYLYFKLLNYSLDDFQPLINVLTANTKFILFLIFYFGFYLIFLIFVIVNENANDVEYLPLIDLQCSNRPDYITPYLKTFSNSASYFGILGWVCGILIDKLGYKFPKDNIVYISDNVSQDNTLKIGNWNNTLNKESIFRFILVLLEILLFNFIVKLIFGNLGNEHFVWYFLQEAVTCFGNNFMLFSLCKISSIKLKLSNTSLKNEENPQFLRKSSKKIHNS